MARVVATVETGDEVLKRRRNLSFTASALVRNGVSKAIPRRHGENRSVSGVADRRCQKAVVRFFKAEVTSLPPPLQQRPPLLGDPTNVEETEKQYRLRYLQRYRGDSYVRMADRIIALANSPSLGCKPLRITVDATGVGRAVIDLMRERGLDITAVTITGGDTVSRSRMGPARTETRPRLEDAGAAAERSATNPGLARLA